MLHEIGRYPRALRVLAVLVIAIIGLLSTIASSSGGSGGTPPAATITFPSPGFETSELSLTVTGTASDETGVAAVSVNGQNASSDDGFATWQVVVELTEGANTLTVATLDTLGFSSLNAAEVVVNVLSSAPLATVTFPPRNSFSDADSVTVTGTATDVSSGVESVTVNGVEATTGDEFATWRAEAVPLSAGANTLTVETVDIRGFADPAAAEVVVNVAADVSGNAVTFGDGYAVALDGNRAYVLDFDNDQLVRVNVNTGADSIISDAATGSGPALSGPDGIALINGGTTALVSNFLPDELLSVDLAGGGRSRLSSASQNVGSGPTLFGPSGIGIVDATLAVVSNYAADDVMTVDRASGDRTVLSGDGTRGAGPGFLQPDGIAMDSANNRILVTDALVGAVIAVDLTTGDRTIVSDNDTVGTGPDFVNPVGIVLLDFAAALLVADRGANLLWAVNLANGDRVIFSDANTNNKGEGPSFSSPTGIALDMVNNRVVVSGQNLVVVELVSGDRVIVGQ